MVGLITYILGKCNPNKTKAQHVYLTYLGGLVPKYHNTFSFQQQHTISNLLFEKKNNFLFNENTKYMIINTCILQSFHSIKDNMKVYMAALVDEIIDYFSSNVQETCIILKEYLMQQPITFVVLDSFSSEIGKCFVHTISQVTYIKEGTILLYVILSTL